MQEYELTLRLGFFLGMLIVMMCWERGRPKRKLMTNKNARWRCNLSLVVMNSLAIKLLIPFTAASVALYAEQHHIGLLHSISLPLILSIALSVTLLDALIYGQHVAFHHIPFFWRLHKIHHMDRDIDVTTGVRFHPVEIILSALLKCGFILLLGVPFAAVVIFEIALNATAMFNHSNIRLPIWLDKWLRLILVTPDMHRVHHSTIEAETNSNFGFNLPWWDRTFGTYQAQPSEGHDGMTIGLIEHQQSATNNLGRLITEPLRRQP